MSDENNGKKSLGEAFDKLMKGRELTVIEQLKQLADQGLPTVKNFRAEGGDFMVEMGAEMAHGMLTRLDPMDLMMVSIQIQANADKDALKAAVQNALASSLDPRKAVAAALSAKEIATQLTKEQNRDFALTLRSVSPARLQAFFDKVQGITESNVVKKIDAAYDATKTKTVDQLAQESIARAQRLPAAQIADKLVVIARNLTPVKITALAGNFAKQVTAADFAKLGTSGLAFVEEFLTNASNETPFAANYTDEAKAFGPALKKALQAAEDSLAVSGIVPDLSDLKPAMTAYYGTKKGRGPQGPAV